MEKVNGSITKKDFCKVLQKSLATVLGTDISLDKAYTVFKLCQLLPYHIANKKNYKVTLGGIGMYRMYKTSAGNKTPKYYGSDTVVRICTLGQDLLDYVMHPQKYRNPDGTIGEDTPKKEVTKKEAPKKEAPRKEAPKKKEVAKEEPVEEAPKKKPIIKNSPTKAIPEKAKIEAEIADEVSDDDLSIDFDDEDFEL